MARVARFSDQLVSSYEVAGLWTREYPVDYWEANARKYPHRNALVFGSDRFTWLQAVEAVHKLAAGLVKSGFRKDDIIALHAPNSATLLLLRLAAEKAGVISLLVPPAFSRLEVERISQQLSLAGAVVCADDRGRDVASGYVSGARQPSFALFSIGNSKVEGSHPVAAWLEREWSAGEIEEALHGRSFGPYEYSAIITTSGTTGAPRFVEHTACARSCSGRVYIERLKLGPDDVIVGTTSIFAGNCDLLLYHAAPQAGARAVLMDHFDPGTACRIIEAERATVAIFVPTLLHRLLEYKGLGDHDLSSLRMVTSFGAILVPEKAAEVERALGVKVIQGYGASDYGALASTGIEDPEHVRRTGVGRPLTGTEVRICDESGVELPTGAFGRIHARGPHCVGGFVGDALATEQAWHSGFYPMGDVGRIDDDGYLWLAGRARELVIRGGQNIVPAEVEDVILTHPDVAEAAVLGTPDAEMGERVCVVIVPRSGAQLTLEALTDFLKHRGLARFKHPEQLLSVSSMPLNPAGTKIDKQALREQLLRR